MSLLCHIKNIMYDHINEIRETIDKILRIDNRTGMKKYTITLE